jgi:hypothetical protein
MLIEMAKGFKTGGRKPNTPNKVTREFKETVLALLRDNSENVSRWLETVANGDPDNDIKPDPYKALDMLGKLAEYATPKLARTEHIGDADNPIQTNLTVTFK